MGSAATTSDSRSKRLGLFKEAERAALYDRPHFTDEEQVGYFTLSPADLALMHTFIDPVIQAFFVLTLGYFKANQRFHTVTLEDARPDLEFIIRHLDLAVTPDELRIPHARTIKEQRDLILDVTGYRRCTAADRRAAFHVASRAARISPKPLYLVRVVLHHFAIERIMLPGYSYLQEEIIGTAITTEEQRLIGHLLNHLPAPDRAALDALFEERDGRYHLTLLRRAPKSLTPKQLRQERARGDELRPLYDLAERLLPILALSPDAVSYYASLVGVYTAPRLKDLESWMVYIYLLCFIFHRYHRLHDHVLTGLIHDAKSFRDEAKRAAADRVATYRLERTQDVIRAGTVLQLFTDDQPPPELPFVTVQAHAFMLLDRERLARTADYLATGADCDEDSFFWQHVDTMGRRFKGRLRPLLLGVDLSAVQGQTPLLDAVRFLQHTFQRGKSLAQVDPAIIPTRCIPVRLKRYLYDRGTGTPQLILDRFEFLIYHQIRGALEAGELVCHRSTRFRSIEDDLIPMAEWEARKDAYLAELNRPILLQPITEHLAELEQELEEQFVRVNGRVARGENAAVRITHRGSKRRWSLSAPKGKAGVNHALFEHLPHVSLNQVLAFVDQECGWSQAFEHVLGRYAHHTRDDRTLRACLIAWGTNLGLHRMGDISDIPGSSLVRVSGNYLRLETLQAANTRIVNAMAASPLFRHYDLDGVVYSTSDGQKFETDLPTFNARHSPKYFGMGKGVVATSLVINHVPVHAKLISAHDHERHWVFDLLYNNPTDIISTVHTTDTHGTNQVNVALLKVFGHEFAPRYADLPDKMRTALYGFQQPSAYGEDALFRPVRKLNTDLIMRHWDHLQRIFVSLGRKTTSQSILVSKLSSAKRRSQMLQALWEYDTIHRSQYLLSYVDSPQLRRNVQRSLNRGEQYHHLKKALSHANAGRLRYRTEDEQALWNEACRLLVNAILFYNMRVIERAIAIKEAQGDAAGVAFLRSVSPVAWHHINFYGFFAFQEEPPLVPLDACVAAVVRYGRKTPGDDEDDS